jgi:hypothetical protein
MVYATNGLCRVLGSIGEASNEVFIEYNVSLNPRSTWV